MIHRLIARILPADRLGRQLVVRGSGSLIASTAGLALALAIQLPLARLLGPEEFGEYAYAMAWVLTLSGCVKLGLDTTSLRVLSGSASRGNWGEFAGYARFAALAVLGVSSVVAALIALRVVVTPLHRLHGAAPILAAGILPLLALLELTGAGLQSLKRNVSYQTLYGTARPLILGGALWVAIYALGMPSSASSALASVALATLSVLVVASAMLRSAWPAEARTATPAYDIRAWLSIAIPLYLIAVCQLVLSRADVLIVGAAIGPRESGGYVVANQVASLVTFGIAATNIVMAPLIAELFAAGDETRLQEMLRVSQRLVWLYTAPVCIALVFFGRPILGLFGPDFRDAYVPMLMLAGGQAVIAACGPVGFLMTMTKHQGAALAIIASAAAAQLVLVALLVPHFGVLGAAAGSAIANAARSLSLAAYIRSRMNVRITIV